MGAHSGPDIVTDGLVLCLDAANPESYPGTGTTWTDLSGNGNDALFLGGPLFSDENKGGIVFDGTDDYSRPNTSHSYLESSTLSITLKFSSYNNENIVLFGYRHNSGYSNPTIGTIFASAGRFSASVITYTEVYRIVTLSPSFNVGEIYTIDLTKDIVNGILKLYLNGGQYIATQTFDASAYAQWTTAGSYVGANILDIGLSSNTVSSQGWINYLNGIIYNLKLYNKILSESEIQQNFNATRGRFSV